MEAEQKESLIRIVTAALLTAVYLPFIAKMPV